MWTYDYPTQPGYYWFYGYPYGPNYSDPRIIFVTARKIKDDIICTGAGFIYERESIGVWVSAKVPAISELLDLEIKNEGKMER